MSDVDVAIYLPYALEDAAGNSVTALRLRRQLKEAGYSVVMVTPRDELISARCLIALNAWRSSEVIESFHGKVILLLTGTDINDKRVTDFRWEGRRAMEKADQLIVLQKEAFDKIPDSLKQKSRVINPSVILPTELKYLGHSGAKLRIILAGRYRPEKQPGLVLDACRRLPKNANLMVEWYGAITAESAPHFQWQGPIAQEELWQEMARADLFLNASSEEGGANAVCEAINLGLPVIASDIGGNIGLLGEDYAGYFESGNASALAETYE